MSTPPEQMVSALNLSEGAQKVLQQIVELTEKSPGEAVAEGLALALLYEQTRKQHGRLMVEVGGKTQVIEVP